MPKESKDFERTEGEAKFLEGLAWCCVSLSLALLILWYSFHGFINPVSGDLLVLVVPFFFGALCEIEMRRIRSSIKYKEGIAEKRKLITLVYWPFIKPFITVIRCFYSPPTFSNEVHAEAVEPIRCTNSSEIENSHETVSSNRGNSAVGNNSSIFIDILKIPTWIFISILYRIAIVALIALSIGFAIGLLAGFIWLIKFLWYHV